MLQNLSNLSDSFTTVSPSLTDRNIGNEFLDYQEHIEMLFFSS